MTDTENELLAGLIAAMNYIDAIPDDVAATLPAMPGFERDWVDNILANGMWIPVSQKSPDPFSPLRVCAFTPSPHADMRYRFVAADMFRQVCTDATHWFYIKDPEA